MPWNTFDTSLNYGAPAGGGGGLLGITPSGWENLGNLGFGLLASSAPSTTGPVTFGSALGKAGLYAAERRDAGLLNDARRLDIQSKAQEMKGLADMQAWAAKNPTATDEQFQAAATQYFPELAIKARLGNILSPKDQLQMMQIQALIQGTQSNILKTQQEIQGKGAESETPARGVMLAVERLDTAFDTVEKEGNPFGPSGMFNKDAPLGKVGINAETALGLPDIVLKQFGDPGTIRKQGQVAQLIDKETATISQNLSQLATRGTGRSATAINNLNTALGEGNIAVPVRRVVIEQALDQVLGDLRANGIQYEPQWDTLLEKLKGQTKDISAPTGSTLAPGLNTQSSPAAPAAAAPAPAASPIMPAQFAFPTGDAAIPPAPPSQQFNTEFPNYVMQGPGVSSTLADLIPGYSALPTAGEAIARTKEAAAPYIQQGSKAAASISEQLSKALPADGMVVRKVGTLSLNAVGKPVFKYLGDAQRALEQGLLDAYTEVVVGGKTVDIK